MKNSGLAMVLLVLLAGCSSVSVTRDYDESADFGALQTFAWKHDIQPRTGNPRIDNDLIDERVRDAVDAALMEKGFLPVDREDADCLVAYYIEYKQRIGGSTVSFGVGTGSMGRYGGVGYNTGISDYDEGYLTIDIINPVDDKTIWRGVGRRATYESASPEKVTRIVNKAVSRILARFPPTK